MSNEQVRANQRIHLPEELPPPPHFEPGIRRAPKRNFPLTKEETHLALRNALRYIPPQHHKILLPEFREELETRGRIYGYRYRPQGKIVGKSVDQYQGKCLEGKALPGPRSTTI